MGRDRDLDQYRDRVGRLIRSVGPWPFITQQGYQRVDQSRWVWRSRDHRKMLSANRSDQIAGVVTVLRRGLWMPQTLNWWIGVIFALGSFLFALGSVLSLAPALAKLWSIQSGNINAIYFAGSVPFTAAAYLQLFQAANAAQRSASESSRSTVWFGWYLRDIGWLSSALQFPGTVLFNVNTWDAMQLGLKWFQQDLDIWAPDFVGSVLFLASGYLGFVETCHTYWRWKPSSLSWWITFTNLLGCIGFMIAALFAFVLPKVLIGNAANLSIGFTLFGAVFFFIGSLLMLPEAARSISNS